MTGAELLAQVREALTTWGTDWYGPNPKYKPAEKQAAAALTDLDGCILLTREEAERVITEAEMALAGEHYIAWLHALLTPEPTKEDA